MNVTPIERPGHWPALTATRLGYPQWAEREVTR